MEIADWIGRRIVSAHTGQQGETVLLLDNGTSWRVVAAGATPARRIGDLAEIDAHGVVRQINPE